jgi:hypothetical protein
VDIDDLAHVLRDEVAELVKGASLNIIEFCVDGIITWEVRRDRNGTPRAWYWSHPGVTSPDGDQLYPHGDNARMRDLIEGQKRLLCVVNSLDERTAEILGEFERNRPDMRVFRTGIRVPGLLRDVITNARLTRRYELVVLRRGATGRAMLDGQELFAESTMCPKTTRFTVHCEPSNGRGTVFAVVATEGARDFRLLTAQAADIPAGRYDMTAELVRPGLVRFSGLPTPLTAENRSWAELIAEIPADIATLAPTHLIFAIEVSGGTDQIISRVDRARQVIRQANDSEGALRVSLIIYGAHSFDRKVPDEPARELRWRVSRRAALAALDELEIYSPVAKSYPRAAQLECALALLKDRLSLDKRTPSRSERTVLVTVGVRPPFPPRVDTRTTILPCPHRNDWRTDRRQLVRVYREMAFGAIHDSGVFPPGADGEVWRELGSAILVGGTVVNPRAFATELKLRMSAEGFPFPLAESGGNVLWHPRTNPPNVA